MAKGQDKTVDRIAKVLRDKFPKDAIVDVSPSGVRDNLHVLVVSRTLDSKTEPQKQECLWRLLKAAVKNGVLEKTELDRVSLILPISVSELRR